MDEKLIKIFVENFLCDFYCNEVVNDIINTKSGAIEIERLLRNISTKYILKIIDIFKHKLAESEKELEIVCVEGKDKVRENIELKQQLAEKDKEIEELSYKLNEKQKSDSGRGWKLENGKIIYFCNYLSDYKCERSLEDVVKDLNQMTKESDVAWEIRTLYQGLKNNNQDKISFAVDKLKEVKKLFEEKYTYDVEESDYAVIYEDDVDVIIDNQIKQLKKED